MSPGPAEEAGSTVRTAIGAMASTPAVLAVVLLAAFFAAIVFYSVDRERKQAHEVEMEMVERCFPIALMHAVRDETMKDFRREEEKGPEP